MDGLRWILLGVGLLFLAAVYGWSRWQAGRQRRDAGRGKRGRNEPQLEPLDPDVELGLKPHPDDIDEHEPVRLDGSRAASPPPHPDIEEHIISLYLLAPRGEVLLGNDIKKAFQGAGLEFGHMDIYHRYPPGVHGGDAVFSVANLVEPGVFKPSTMATFSTPGLAMFLRLPGPVDGLTAFDDFIATARLLASRLGVEVLDQQRSVLSEQTIGHMREAVIEHERRQRAAYAGA